jgi:uncharacterized Zn-binding protein involved in type VI secretion
MRRSVPRVLVALLLILSIAPVAGCEGLSDADYLDQIERWLADQDVESLDEEDASGDVELTLTYPVGASPKVFTTGWLFGARCTVDTPDGQTDLSENVQWSGTGSFSPDRGPRSRPSFSGAGANEITLSCEVGGEVVEKTFRVQAVSPAGYAHVGSVAKAPSVAFGALGCPHAVVGPITTGSPTVYIGGKPAARVGDVGVAAADCGPNSFKIIDGDSSVMIDGRPAAKIGSQTDHYGGLGSIVGGG